jgi:hypothetical protein
MPSGFELSSKVPKQKSTACLYTKLEMYKDSVTIEKDDLVQDILQEMLKHVGGTLNCEDSKCQIIESLLKIETEGHKTVSPQE